MSSISDYSKNRDALKAIRFIVFATTILYGLINLVYGPGDAPSGNTAFSSTTAAMAVGVIQLFVAFLGLSLDLTDSRMRGILKFTLLALCLTYVYEGVLVITSTGDPFDWAPLFVYAALSAVLYLAKE